MISKVNIEMCSASKPKSQHHFPGCWLMAKVLFRVLPANVVLVPVFPSPIEVVEDLLMTPATVRIEWDTDKEPMEKQLLLLLLLLLVIILRSTTAYHYHYGYHSHYYYLVLQSKTNNNKNSILPAPRKCRSPWQYENLTWPDTMTCEITGRNTFTCHSSKFTTHTVDPYAPT